MNWRDFKGYSPKQREAADAVFSRKRARLLYGGAGFGGKMLALDTPVATPDGFRLMGDIKVGDTVLAMDGCPTVVVAVSPIEEQPDAHRITFSSGESFLCDAGHLWLTMTCSERAARHRRTDGYRARRRSQRASRAKECPEKPWAARNIATLNREREYEYLPPPVYQARTTEEIRDTLLHRGHEYNHVTPVCAPLQLPERELPIEPYLLGLWLGDGHSQSGCIGMITADLEEVLRLVPRQLVSIGERKPGYSQAVIAGLTTDIRRVGLRNNKHIPTEYLRASHEQRLELLRGLMDTDGHASPDSGACELSFSSRRLAEGALELLASLGIKASLEEKPTACRMAYRMKFSASVPVFHLGRKRRAQRLDWKPRVQQRAIVSVEPVEPVPMRCIQVAHPSGTYLIGRTLVVTHNSQMLRWMTFELNARLAASGHPGQWGALACKVGVDLQKRHLGRLEDDLRGPDGRLLGKVRETRKRGLHFEFFNRDYGGFYLLHLEDADRLRSAEYSWFMVDELTECTRDDFGRILYSIRSGKDLPVLPFIAGSNPDGPHHPWVKKLWIERDFTGEEDSAFNPADFIFVPALPTDNPVWSDELAASQFAGLPANVREARLTGSWDVVEKARFPQFHRETHVFKMADWFPKGFPKEYRHFRAIDWGFGVPYCCLWAAQDEHGNVFVYREDYRKSLTPFQQVVRILEATGDVEITATYVDPSIAQTKGADMGQKPVSVLSEYRRYGLDKLVLANNNRQAGWAVIDRYLDQGNNYPNVYIEEGCKNLIREIASLPIDDRSLIIIKKEDTRPDASDHAADALRYLLVSLAKPPMADPMDAIFASKESLAQHLKVATQKAIDEACERMFNEEFKDNDGFIKPWQFKQFR